MLSTTEYIWGSFSELIMDEMISGIIESEINLNDRIYEILKNTIKDDDGEDTAPTVVEECVDRFLSSVKWHVLWNMANEELSLRMK